MFDRLRAFLLIRNEPELREHRNSMARGITIACAALLVTFLIGDVIQYFLVESSADYNFTYDIVMIAGIGAVLVFVWRMIQRGETIIAGYILSIALFIVISITIFLFPEGLLFYSSAFMLPIMIISSIVGDLTIYPLAFAEMIVLILAWGNARRTLDTATNLYATEYGFLFFLIEIIVLAGSTVLLYLLSQAIRNTIRSLHSQSNEMTQLAHTDPLTGLSNRRYLVEQLQREFDRAKRYNRPLGLVYLDLDGFKSINDHFGHMFGDEVLRSTALSMRAVLRSTDLLARIGGDEFAVLLPETSLQGAQGVVTKLRKSLAATSKRLGPAVPTLSFCAGISQVRDKDDTFDALLSRADDAQYMAKTSGAGLTRSQVDIDQLPLFDDGP